MPEHHPALRLLRLLPLFLLAFALLTMLSSRAPSPEPRTLPPAPYSYTTYSSSPNSSSQASPQYFSYGQTSGVRSAPARRTPSVSSSAFLTPAQQVAARTWPLTLLAGVPLVIAWASARRRSGSRTGW